MAQARGAHGVGPYPFRARPMGRASNRVLQVKITSFGLDSSRNRKSVVKLFSSDTSFSEHED